MKISSFITLVVMTLLVTCATQAQNQALAHDVDAKKRGNSDTNHQAIPPVFDSNGKYTSEGMRFTTQAYEKEAFRLVLQEANLVAKELQLPEKLPITETDVRPFVCGYGSSRLPPRSIGNVHTRDYGYFVTVDHKLSYVEGSHQNRDCMKWIEQYRWPKSRIDTNAAYQLAAQWLTAVHMDVEGLNRDCELHVEPERYYNGIKVEEGIFVPIYQVYWVSPQNRAEGYGDVATVTLLAPTKTLMSLRVEDSKYILRKPLVFTNLAELLSQTNISVAMPVQPEPRTNAPAVKK